MLRSWCALYILTWKRASRQSGVQFLISHLVSWLRTRRSIGSLLFDPPEPQIIGKSEWIATFLPFRAPASSFLPFSSLIFSLLFFSSLTLPTSAFPSVHIVGSLTSKLPSTKQNCAIFGKLTCISITNLSLHRPTEKFSNFQPWFCTSPAISTEYKEYCYPRR